MNKSLHATMALLATLAAPAVHAADENFYAGLALSGGGDLIVRSEGERFDSTNSPTSVRLYGGYDINQHFSIDAGYARFGKFKFAAPVTIDLSAFHVAAKGRVALGESFSLFGKLGATRHRVGLAIAQGSGSATSTRPLLGIGADYRFNKNLSLALELTDYGTIKEDGLNVKMRMLEAGIKYHF